MNTKTTKPISYMLVSLVFSIIYVTSANAIQGGNIIYAPEQSPNYLYNLTWIHISSYHTVVISTPPMAYENVSVVTQMQFESAVKNYPHPDASLVVDTYRISSSKTLVEEDTFPTVVCNINYCTIIVAYTPYITMSPGDSLEFDIYSNATSDGDWFIAGSDTAYALQSTSLCPDCNLQVLNIESSTGGQITNAQILDGSSHNLAYVVMSVMGLNTANITIHTNTGGSVDAYRNGAFVQTVNQNSDVTIPYNMGDTYSFSANPLQGYYFVEFCPDLGCSSSSTNNPLTGTITSPGDVYAFFNSGTATATPTATATATGTATATPTPTSTPQYTPQCSNYYMDTAISDLSVQANVKYSPGSGSWKLHLLNDSTGAIEAIHDDSYAGLYYLSATTYGLHTLYLNDTDAHSNAILSSCTFNLTPPTPTPTPTPTATATATGTATATPPINVPPKNGTEVETCTVNCTIVVHNPPNTTTGNTSLVNGTGLNTSIGDILSNATNWMSNITNTMSNTTSQISSYNTSGFTSTLTDTGVLDYFALIPSKVWYMILFGWLVAMALLFTKR
jgi:hypothetical protein